MTGNDGDDDDDDDGDDDDDVDRAYDIRFRGYVALLLLCILMFDSYSC